MVSIIVPIYNARRYLRQTAGDLLRQTYRDIEVIFVDDGSTDGSGELLERLALRDERVRVIHQENGGTARARNAGIAAASGRYLMFMDDDDRIPRGYVQEYVDAIEQTGSDIVIGGYRRVTPEGKVMFSRRLVGRLKGIESGGRAHSEDTVTRSENFRSCSGDAAAGSDRIRTGWLFYINISPWAKIYRRSFVEKSRAHFLEYPYGEDIYFQMMLQAAGPKVSYISSVSYGWVDRKGSISNTIHKGIREEADIFPMLDSVLEIHPEKDEYFRYFMYRHCAYHIYVSGRDADRDRLAGEFARCRGWLRRHDMVPSIGPMSPKLKGEIMRDRIAVLVIKWVSRLHLERLFARIYCRGQKRSQ